MIKIPQTGSANPDAIERLNACLGDELPNSYLEFVRLHHAAVPPDNSFRVGPRQESMVLRFTDVNEAAAICSEGWFPADGIAFSEDGCGNYTYVGRSTGAVYFWDHELDELGTQLADSIAGFLTLLEPFDPASVELEQGQVKHVWIDPNFKPEFD